MARRQNRFAEQATLDAIVRFGPELSGLKALVAQAQKDKRSQISSARSTAESILSTIDQARPQVTEIYDAAGAERARTAGLVSGDLARLQGVNPSILAASTAEQAGAADRLTAARAASLTDLGTQRVAAQRGRQFAVQRAQSDFVDAVSKVLQRRQDLAQEQGAFVASEVGKARDAARQQRLAMKKLNLQLTQQERNSIRSSGVDPDTGLPTQDAKIKIDAAKQRQKDQAQREKDKNKPKRVTSGQQLSFGNEYQDAMNKLRTAVAPNRSVGRNQARGDLLNGLEAVTEKRRNKDGLVVTEVKAPAVKPVNNPLAARVALDMYYDGHLSKETVRILRKNGIRVKALPGVRMPSQNVFNTKRPVSGTVVVGTGTGGKKKRPVGATAFGNLG